MTSAGDLRAQNLRAEAEALGSTLPPLLAEAEHLAATVLLGEHGRRRAGTGDDFWQYRAAHAGDPVRAVDWRLIRALLMDCFRPVHPDRSGV